MLHGHSFTVQLRGADGKMRARLDHSSGPAVLFTNIVMVHMPPNISRLMFFFKRKATAALISDDSSQ